MIYQGDVQNIEYEAAIEDEACLWKTALFGGHQDRRTLRRLRRLFRAPFFQRQASSSMAASYSIFWTSPWYIMMVQTRLWLPCVDNGAWLVMNGPKCRIGVCGGRWRLFHRSSMQQEPPLVFLSVP